MSLKDLDLSQYLADLIDAGISSFKIEGRLKDINYVKNVTGFFRKRIDDILENRIEYQKSSIGEIQLGFEPNLEKTFNRGKSDYFLNGRDRDISSTNTPKSIGEEIGEVQLIKRNSIVIEFKEKNKIISNGDGLCFFDSSDELQGFLVNSVNQNEVFPNQMPDIKQNTIIYRNQDQQFENSMKSAKTERKLLINLDVIINENEIIISNSEKNFQKKYALENTPTNNPEQLLANIKKQFSKTGNTIFKVSDIQISISDAPPFIPISKLNEIRRDYFEEYEKQISDNYIRELIERPKPTANYFLENVDYQVNIANKLSRELYQLSGVKNIEQAFELQNNFDGKIVMTTKHCLKFESGICPIYQKADKTISEPLWLDDGNHKYKLEFDCKNCEMRIRY